MATIKNAQGVLVDSLTGLPVAQAGGVGSYGTYSVPGTTETIGVDKAAFDQMQSVGTEGLAASNQGWGDKVANWFTPQGDRGTSVGGNIMGAVGTGVGAATGLAGMYYAKKNFDLQKDQQNYLKGREAQSDARKTAFAANAGNGAQY